MNFIISIILTAAIMIIVIVISYWLHNARYEQLIKYVKRSDVQNTSNKYKMAEFRIIILRDLSMHCLDFLKQERSDGERRIFFKFTLRMVLLGVAPLEQNARIRILLLDENRLKPVYDYVPVGNKAFRGTTFAIGETEIGEAFQSRSIIVNDELDEEKAGAAGYKCVLCIPIPYRAEDTTLEPIGILNLDSPDIGFYNDQAVAYLVAVANLLYSVLS